MVIIIGFHHIIGNKSYGQDTEGNKSGAGSAVGHFGPGDIWFGTNEFAGSTNRYGLGRAAVACNSSTWVNSYNAAGGHVNLAVAYHPDGSHNIDNQAKGAVLLHIINRHGYTCGYHNQV